jgi:hypothetical protein
MHGGLPEVTEALDTRPRLQLVVALALTSREGNQVTDDISIPCQGRI